MGTCLCSPIGTQYEAAVLLLGLQLPSNNWGQININFVNQRGQSLRGAERFLVLQYEEAPLRLCPL
jgi:hypothetical protein